MKLTDIELEIHKNFQERQLFCNPLVLVTASKALANRVSAKFIVLVLPFTYVDAEGPHRRIGARWEMFVPNAQSWSISARQQLINIVIDEVQQYIEKGHIERENSTHDIDDSRYRLRRFGNPTN